MKNKLVFRMIGAVSSAMIIVSLFIPFVSVTGFSQTLWEAYELTKSLYLPIMIIVFGAIGIFVFSTNIKIEFAYSTSGAILFYVISESISFIKQDMLSELSVGYYMLIIGALLTGVMSFICNLRVKKKEVIKQTKVEEVKESSVIENIDKLYGEENNNTNELVNPTPVEMFTQVEPTIIEPQVISDIPVQPVEPVEPVQPVTPIPVQSVEEVPATVVEQANNVSNIQPVIPVQQYEPIEAATNSPLVAPVEDIIPIMPSNIETKEVLNPVINEDVAMVTDAPIVNPVVSEFTQPTSSPTVNPVISEFTQPVENPTITEFNPTMDVNPVISEFNNAPSENPVVSSFDDNRPNISSKTDNLDIFN